MKKLIALLMALLLAVGMFAACDPRTELGGDGELGPLDGVEYDARANEMYVDTTEGKSRIKISYTPGFGDTWVVQSARAFLLDELGADYYFEFDNDPELTTGVSSKLESGMNLSDIYFPLASNWYSYAALGYLENLDSLYNMTVPGED